MVGFTTRELKSLYKQRIRMGYNKGMVKSLKLSIAEREERNKKNKRKRIRKPSNQFGMNFSVPKFKF